MDAQAHRVRVWHCLEDGDTYVVGPWDGPLGLTRILYWHVRFGHAHGPVPRGKFWTFVVYVGRPELEVKHPRDATAPRATLRVLR